MLQKQKHSILHLSLITGIGPATIKAIIERVGIDNLESIYQYTIADFAACGISHDRAAKLVSGLKDCSLVESELALLAKHNISWCVLGDDDYSSLLEAIEQPPAVIYYQGANLFNQERSIAFVGSRKADAYARVIVDLLVPPLVERDWVIVSGGALGTDSLVHDRVVKSGGKTIVVLGSGLLHWYPSSNIQLFNQVIQTGGMIVSCFQLQAQPIAANFPARNRIIAGLSRGTVVVQAARKSGALITADFAVEQGKEVFAVPGSIEYGLHDGCHHIIQQGAKLVTNVSDILVEFGYAYQTLENIEQQMNIPAIEKYDDQDLALLQKLVMPMSTDDLLNHCPMSLEDLLQKLFDLHLQGKISQDMMGLWKRI